MLTGGGGGLLCLSVQAPHQGLPHSGHGEHTEADLLQLVEDHAGGGIHVVLRTTEVERRILIMVLRVCVCACMRASETKEGWWVSFTFLVYYLWENQSSVNCLCACSLPPTPCCISQHPLSQIANDNTLPDLYFISWDGLLPICRAAETLCSTSAPYSSGMQLLSNNCQNQREKILLPNDSLFLRKILLGQPKRR